MTQGIFSFLEAEDGAVSVDWVVLTGAITGLGMATMAVFSGGLENLSGDLAQTLGNVELQEGFWEAVETASSISWDFADGPGGFSGGNVVTLGGIGEVLQLGANETARTSVEVPANAQSAVVEFDLYGLDSLNSENATVTVNGEIAGQVTVNNGVASFNAINGGGVVFEASNASQGTDLTQNGMSDSRTQVRVTVGNPGGTVDVQVHSGSGAGVSNESFAIDNFNVNAS